MARSVTAHTCMPRWLIGVASRDIVRLSMHEVLRAALYAA